MTEPNAKSTLPNTGWRWLVTAVLIISMTLSWTNILDHAAHTATGDNLKDALAIAGIARVFNGVISVAQGTELAIAPVGVGVTLTLGEVLDPFNDLVERFSLLALAASVALSMQMLLGEIAQTPALTIALTLTGIGYLILLWWPQPKVATHKFTHVISTVVGAIILLRFLTAIVLLSVHWVDTELLSQRQAEAVARLQVTADEAQQIQQETTLSATQSANASDRTGSANGQASARIPENKAEESGFFSRATQQFKSMFEDTSAQLDLQGRLAKLQARISDSVEDMVLLIVIFALQTLILPILSAYLIWWSLRLFWQTVSQRQNSD